MKSNKKKVKTIEIFHPNSLFFFKLDSVYCITHTERQSSSRISKFSSFSHFVLMPHILLLFVLNVASWM